MQSINHIHGLYSTTSLVTTKTKLLYIVKLMLASLLFVKIARSVLCVCLVENGADQS